MLSVRGPRRKEATSIARMNTARLTPVSESVLCGAHECIKACAQASNVPGSKECEAPSGDLCTKSHPRQTGDSFASEG